jgi:hypothetical protein
MFTSNYARNGAKTQLFYLLRNLDDNRAHAELAYDNTKIEVEDKDEWMKLISRISALVKEELSDVES